MSALALLAVLGALDGASLTPPPPPPELSSAESRRAAPDAEPDAPAAEPDARARRPLDISADVLPSGRMELSLFWGTLSLGVAKRLQLSWDLAGAAVGLLNMGARVQLLDEAPLRATFELGGAWWVVAMLMKGQLVSVPAELRASVPLFEAFELSLATRASWMLVKLAELDFNSLTLGAEATLWRHDRRGAFLLQGRLPLVAGNVLTASEVLGIVGASGSIWFDDTRGWSVLFARDQLVGSRARLRVGLGYRARPGVLFLESLGNVLVSANVRWRF